MNLTENYALKRENKFSSATIVCFSHACEKIVFTCISGIQCEMHCDFFVGIITKILLNKANSL